MKFDPLEFFEDSPEGWSKLGDVVVYRQKGSTQVYDEPALRETMVGFLSNESASRFGPDKFLSKKEYKKQLEWFMEGFGLFYEKVTDSKVKKRKRQTSKGV